MVANQITTDFLRLAEKRPNDPNSASVRKTMSLRWLTKFTFSTLFDQVLRRIERPQKAILLLKLEVVWEARPE
ncbi:unnamed protein product [Brassica napus]|uniref:(rape) hypothetical protein n=1 Tax=Brassica napus TaxID=3708 RepID=A0A816J460_BRANA|nr:unnamed protein product [Brassica napus]